MKFQTVMDNEDLEAVQNELQMYSEEEEKPKPKPKQRTCKYCNKALKCIGTSRKGGNYKFYDSDTRQYHIKCLKQNKEDQRRYEAVQQLLLHPTIYDSLLENLGKNRW